MIKHCRRCGDELVLETNWNPKRAGRRNYICKGCDKIEMKEYREAIVNNKNFTMRLRRKIAGSLVNHRKNGIIVNGALEDYIKTYKPNCVYCGFEFDIFSSDTRVTGSMDRIDQELTMTPSTVQWICYECNRSKGIRTHEEFVKYCKTISSKFL